MRDLTEPVLPSLFPILPTRTAYRIQATDFELAWFTRAFNVVVPMASDQTKSDNEILLFVAPNMHVTFDLGEPAVRYAVVCPLLRLQLRLPAWHAGHWTRPIPLPTAKPPARDMGHRQSSRRTVEAEDVDVGPASSSDGRRGADRLHRVKQGHRPAGPDSPAPEPVRAHSTVAAAPSAAETPAQVASDSIPAMTDTPSEALEWHDFRLDVDDVPLEAEPKGRSVSLVIACRYKSILSISLHHHLLCLQLACAVCLKSSQADRTLGRASGLWHS